MICIYINLYGFSYRAHMESTKDGLFEKFRTNRIWYPLYVTIFGLTYPRFNLIHDNHHDI